jgi:hypothetical protein
MRSYLNNTAFTRGFAQKYIVYTKYATIKSKNMQIKIRF